MRTFDVQGIEIEAPRVKVFEFVRDPNNLPRWTHAFAAVGDGRAQLKTPAGTANIALQVIADESAGTIDWRLEFPDGSLGLAQSRVTETVGGTSIYSFVLHAPPVPLEHLEGTLEAQRTTLRSELATLKSLLEGSR